MELELLSAPFVNRILTRYASMKRRLLFGEKYKDSRVLLILVNAVT